ncbi:MAG: restriction endonuclease subunit S [Deltaproteobacteria bacterium]|nr:restriction endonuclease subunit S [Deltaproteobacteria bacterium]
MSIEFKKVRIGDLGKVVTGKTPPTAREEYFGTNYPFITPTDIDGSRRHIRTERYLSQESRKDFNNYFLPSGAICFVCIGATIGKICMTKVPSFTNQQINSVIVDGKKHDNCFVYYLLSTKKESIKNIAGGAATPIVSKSSFSAVSVEVPELNVQKKIAAILSAYDDLIDNNTRRIKILEEMAQTIYREWFVNFRFPGHEKVKMVDSPLGKIPEGWEATKLGNSVDRFTDPVVLLVFIMRQWLRDPVLSWDARGMLAVFIGPMRTSILLTQYFMFKPSSLFITFFLISEPKTSLTPTLLCQG